MVDSGQSRPTAAAAASSPADSFDLRHALCDLNPSPSNASSIAGPIELFAADYDANGGRIATMVTSPARQAKANRKANRKRNLSSRKDSSKKVDATTSPVQRLRNAVASVTNAVASATDTVLMGAVANPDNVTAPSLNSRNATPSALSTVFDDSALQPPSTKSKNAMCGFIPKSGFLVKMRNLNVPSGPVSENYATTTFNAA